MKKYLRVLFFCFFSILVLSETSKYSIEYKDLSSYYFEYDDNEFKSISVEFSNTSNWVPFFFNVKYQKNFTAILTQGFSKEPNVPPEFSSDFLKFYHC